jgi:cardiolipin synthase
MIAWVVTIFYVLGVAAAIEAIMTARTAQGAIAWSVSLVMMPFVALPAYLVLGRSKFEGTIEAYEQRKDEIDSIISDIRENLKPWTAPRDENLWSYDAIPKLGGMELTHGNRVELLINGEATFDSIIAGIAQAKEYVLVQFYMFHDDGLGRRMQRALIEKAQSGVRVYVLYDEVGSQGLPDSYVDELRAAGVKVSSFNPTQGARNRFQLNFRNHRKMVVVDGISGWVGGGTRRHPASDCHSGGLVLGNARFAEVELDATASGRRQRASHDPSILTDPASRDGRPVLCNGSALGQEAGLVVSTLFRPRRSGSESPRIGSVARS